MRQRQPGEKEDWSKWGSEEAAIVLVGGLTLCLSVRLLFASSLTGCPTYGLLVRLRFTVIQLSNTSGIQSACYRLASPTKDRVRRRISSLFYFINVCACAHMCICVHVCLFPLLCDSAHAHVLACLEAWGQHSKSSLNLLHYYYHHYLLLWDGLSHWAWRLSGQQAGKSLPLPCWYFRYVVSFPVL